MGKDTLQKHDQGPFSQMMRDLEAKNAEHDSTLFAVFGTGDSRAFVFPTSDTIQREGKPVGPSGKEGELLSTETTEFFLTVVEDGFKAIQVDHSNYSYVSTKGHHTIGEDGFSIAEIVARQLGKKDGFFSLSGYKDGELRLDGKLNIGSGGVRYLEHVAHTSNSSIRCRLVEVDEAKVEKILDANIKRVEAMHATSKNVSQALQKVN